MGGPCILIAADGSESKAPDVTDNFLLRPFFFQGFKFHSVEAAFQALKHPHGSPTFIAIASAAPEPGESASAHGHRVWGLGQGGALPPQWDATKVDLMLDLCRARTGQHADLRAALLATGDALIKGRPSTSWSFAGASHNWAIFNGCVMMLVREELRREAAGGGAALVGAREARLRALLRGYREGAPDMSALASVDSLCAALAALGAPAAAAAAAGPAPLCLLACGAGGALDVDKHGAAPGSVMTWGNKHGRKNQQWLLRRVSLAEALRGGLNGDGAVKIHSAENPELLLTATQAHAEGGWPMGCTLRVAAEGAAGSQLWWILPDMRGGAEHKGYAFQLCPFGGEGMGPPRPPWLGTSAAGAPAYTLEVWGPMAEPHRRPTDAEAWHLEDPAGVLTPQALLDLIRAAEVPE
jgi:predicted NAD-dependent protein-ADP-ribosyltransferase YbiA (DUF1768 family)